MKSNKMTGAGLLESGVEIVLAIMIAGFVAGAGVIGLSSMATGQTGTAANAINNATAGILNFTLQLGTVGTKDFLLVKTSVQSVESL